MTDEEINPCIYAGIAAGLAPFYVMYLAVSAVLIGGLIVLFVIYG